MPGPALPLADLKLRTHEVGHLSRGQCDEQDDESDAEREHREDIEVDGVSSAQKAMRGRLDSNAPDLSFEASTIKNARFGYQMMPNGFELSGPARLLSTQKRALAGSAPAICYAYPMHQWLTEADGPEEKASATAATGRRRRPPARAGFDSPLPSLARPPERIGRRRAGPCRQDIFHR